MWIYGALLVLAAGDSDAEDSLSRRMLPVYVKEAQTYSLAVESAPDRPGETLEAKVTVRATGNPRFVVHVSLRVLGRPRRRDTFPARACSS